MTTTNPANNPAQPGRCACGREKLAAWMVTCTACARQAPTAEVICSSDDPAINAWPDEGNGLWR